MRLAVTELVKTASGVERITNLHQGTKGREMERIASFINVTILVLSYNLMQFRQKSNLTAFYRALFQSFDDLQKAFLQLKLERGI